MLPTSLTNLQKRKRTAISIDIKKEICEYIVANPCVNKLQLLLFLIVNMVWKLIELPLIKFGKIVNNGYLFFSIHKLQKFLNNIFLNFHYLIKLYKYGLHKQWQ